MRLQALPDLLRKRSYLLSASYSYDDIAAAAVRFARLFHGGRADDVRTNRC